MTKFAETPHVKILVHTPSVDGYPPEEWEGIWAIPLGEGRFRIDNIPFYARGLSCGDVVEASEVDGALIFQRVVQHSDNSTIRIIIYNIEDENQVRRALLEFGCSIEGVGIDGLIAVNVPKASLERVNQFMNEAFDEDKFDFEEGSLR